MAIIKGGNNPNNALHVDSTGRAETKSVTLSEQGHEALDGDSYNINTGNLTLTSAAETPVFYLKNDSEGRDIVIPRVFVTFAASTGGSGEITGKVIYNPTSGTIITAGTANPPANFNASSSKTLAVTSLTGATGQTVVGGTTPIQFLFPSDSSRHLVSFDTIILPRGASMVFTITPPSGNTSMVIQAGANVYLTSES